jgi:hypothetical protein
LIRRAACYDKNSIATDTMLRALHKALALMPLLLLFPAVGQDTKLTVEQIVQKHLDALGGLDHIRAIQTVALTGSATLMGGQMGAPILIRIKRPGAMRMDMHIQERTFVECFDGTTGWIVNSMSGSGAPQKMSDADAAGARDAGFIDGSLVDYQARGSSVDLVDQETVQGTSAYKLKVTKKSGAVEYVFLNAATFLPIKTVGKRNQHGQMLDYESMPSNYKEVSGVMIPFTLRERVNGRDSMELNITEIDVKKPMDDSVFRMPQAPLAR